MQKTLCKRLYDTDASELILRRSFGFFGSPDGYEESLYRTQDGYYFLYTNGGENSPYPKEDIRRMSPARAEEFRVQAR